MHDPLWYKDAVIYEVHIKSFVDSDGDGIGDLRGLASKLDYLQSLGVTALWLLPFYPSPFRDDGYDIADYQKVHPQFGTLKDFKDFLREAHRRGIRVITELVLNHTSDQHEWFRKARASKPGSYWRDFYVWSDTPEKYKDARIIFTDFETSNWTWDPVAKAYYWHRFYSHQPDLNFDNPNVIKAMLKVVDFWFGLGVDGLRLDALPYLFEREGTNCENLPETFDFIRTLRLHVDAKHQDRMLLAEANQWPEDAAAYFQRGEGCQMAFHFPLMPRLFMASWMEDRFPVVDILDQTPSIPENAQWALFLRNHDELTLEMVSDEERDYMYRVYAKDPSARLNLGIRRRLAPLLGNNRRKIELMNILLFSLPGAPIIYYGDEIGMGDNHFLGDRNGVRTPMQWSADRNAGFSRSNPQRLFLPVIIDPDYHYEAINVDTQERNQSSLLWWMRRVIATRKRFRAFSRGSMQILDANNPKVLAFVREFEDECLLVVANLSRFSQVAEIDLSRFNGYTPEEVVSGNKFPRIRSHPYMLTLGFHGYFWFALRKEQEHLSVSAPEAPTEITLSDSWESVLSGDHLGILEKSLLPAYLATRNWFKSRGRSIRQVRVSEHLHVVNRLRSFELVFAETLHTDGTSNVYLVPLTFLPDALLDHHQLEAHAILCRLHCNEGSGALVDASYDAEFHRLLLQLIGRSQRLEVPHGAIVGTPGERFPDRKSLENSHGSSRLLSDDFDNSLFLYRNELTLKLCRRVEEGPHPEAALGTFLTETAGFEHTPAFLGSLAFERKNAPASVLALVHQFAAHQGTAREFFLGAATGYLETVLAKRRELQLPSLSRSAVTGLLAGEIPHVVQELMGGMSFEVARKIGIRTAGLHAALASGTDDPGFTPEPFSILYQRSVHHAFRTTARRTFEQLRRMRSSLPDPVRAPAEEILQLEQDIIGVYAALSVRKLPTTKIRIHGRYRLGELLFTGNDVVIIDFEGDAERPIGERLLKRSPLRDVAGMMRSFEETAFEAVFASTIVGPDDIAGMLPWMELWWKSNVHVFLRSYLDQRETAALLPDNDSDLDLMLRAFCLDEIVSELGEVMRNRPAQLTVSLMTIRYLLERVHASNT